MPEDQRRRHQPVAQQASAGRRDRRRRRSAAARAAAGRARARSHSCAGTISGRTSRLHGRARPVGGRVDVVGDAVLVDLTRDALLRLRRRTSALSSVAAANVGPVRPQRAVGARSSSKCPAERRTSEQLRPAAASELRHVRGRSSVALAGHQAVRRSSVYGNSRLVGSARSRPARAYGQAREPREPPALRLVAVDRETARSCGRPDASRDTGSRRPTAPSSVSTMSKVSGAWTGMVG